ncbi:spore maturation protein A [Anaerocolumna cellulosilytica]|uniref:Spore maturation protein A n=1 Tax=Anaerocolumna cellulosilytica TaxID=433286 RepID=A0A6S6R9T3_9FIRM|nr:nucleoside recognition domain-containing protein [Anaerocolumna cellulosilytica]MBB5195896.1 spore maturation protein A [Anaerocolumna cellulosilytica]BCJ96907.1 spore maturation protein A [Anaerocolumna cellulosilytica]
MLNYLWGFMIVIGIIVGVLNGRIDEVSTVSLNSAKEAITLCITMLGVMSLWTGIMQVAKAAGITDAFTKALNPILRLLFPDIPKEHIVNEYIASNMIANILGLGWAATPMGLKAMGELRKLNQGKDTASCDMCTFLIINISSLQLIPVNIIAYRSQYGSVSPTEILGAALVATAISTIAGVLFSTVARKLSRNT